MKRITLKLLATSILVLSLQNCATVFTGSTANVSLNTPDGKKVDVEVQSLTGVQNVAAPTSISLKRGNSPVQIRVKDKCYEETSRSLPSKLSWVGLINFLFGTFGTTSAFVDVSSGSFWTYEDSVTIPATRKPHCN